MIVFSILNIFDKVHQLLGSTSSATGYWYSIDLLGSEVCNVSAGVSGKCWI